MMLRLLLSLLYLVAFLSLLYGLWMLIPFLYGLPWVPSRKDRIRRALEMADLKEGELLYDLGAGDGRVLFIAAEEFGARTVGIEASILQYWFIKARILFGGKQAEIQVRRENFFHADFSEADVVFAFLTSKEVALLQEKLQKELKAGARLVAVSADFSEWKPIEFDERHLLFLYEMPPQKGGLIAYLAERKD
jgi:SAM-dependent methyltransferase